MTRSPVQSSKLLIHAIFSTKNQAELISDEIRPLLYDKISKILFDICYSPALAIGGGREHVHILFAQARNWSVDGIIRTVQVKSAQHIRKWCPDFAWQETYAAVSVSRSWDEIEKDLINRQEAIHRTLAYKDEFRKFLEDHGIEYDENDLWS